MLDSETCTTRNPVVEPQNALGLLDVPVNDPPPPYPSPERRIRALRSSRRHTHRPATYISTQSIDSDAIADHAVSPVLHPRFSVSSGPSETTPLLHPASRRRRANSRTSTVVSSSSFSQTVLSLCQDSDTESAVDIFEALRDGNQDPPGRVGLGRDVHPSPPHWFFHKRAWVRYFRPLRRQAYHAAVFHLLVVNFPYALIAWLYLFVFTLTGTTLLITLPLGALLCFLDLLGARVFARGELALQTKFHGPLAYPPPYPPRPIFRRPRSPEESATEAGVSGMQYETSFYKNTYALFTDATSYQALFYFLVIKPGITLCLFLALLVLVPASYALILPAPLMLRFVRKLGIWQANVAVEGLYYQVA